MATLELSDATMQRLQDRAADHGHSSPASLIDEMLDDMEALDDRYAIAEPLPEQVVAEVRRRQDAPLDMSLTVDALADDLCVKYGWDRQDFERLRRAESGR